MLYTSTFTTALKRFTTAIFFTLGQYAIFMIHQVVSVRFQPSMKVLKKIMI